MTSTSEGNIHSSSDTTTAVSIGCGMIVVVDINNAHLGSVFEVDSLEEGKSAIKELAEHKLSRELNNEENESLENCLEVYNEEDADNVWSFSMGFIPMRNWKPKDVNHE